MEAGLLFGRLLSFLFFWLCFFVAVLIDACYVILRALKEFLGFVHYLSFQLCIMMVCTA